MPKQIYRGEMYYADLSPVIGSEQGGKRPVLIIQNNIGNLYSPTVIVAAMTGKVRRKAKLPTHYIVNNYSGLGEDSIKAGTNACIIGLVAVLIFMVIVYGFFGFLADITLIVNGIILLALLSLLNATLTLPGLAGIALTVAMAVDANILIFERMKEEMQKGVTVPKEVIQRGFDGAFSAIFDGQLTTLFAALFLFMLGSGSVRGFGITLGLGLATTMFGALSFNKVLLSAWIAVRKPKKIDL